MKPTVFISHSSRDKAIVARLKELLAAKTGNTLDIFVSSDGQSIRLGHNWVYEIEQALANASLVFVIVSPNSVESHWVYFECGFAYSKGMDVIPVGVLGVDLSRVSPPISLLQGFNVESANGLNNLISVINRKFSYSHHEWFSSEEYVQVFGAAGRMSSNTLGDHLTLVDSVTCNIEARSVNVNERPSLDRLSEHLKSKGIEHSRVVGFNHDRILTYGMTLSKSMNWMSGEEYFKVVAEIDPGFADERLPIVDEVAAFLGAEEYRLVVDFVERVRCLEDAHRISARIYKTEVAIADPGANKNYDYVYRGIPVDFWSEDERAHIATLCSLKMPQPRPLRPLLDVLFNTGVLYRKSEPPQ